MKTLLFVVDKASGLIAAISGFLICLSLGSIKIIRVSLGEIRITWEHPLVSAWVWVPFLAALSLWIYFRSRARRINGPTHLIP